MVLVEGRVGSGKGCYRCACTVLLVQYRWYSKTYPEVYQERDYKGRHRCATQPHGPFPFMLQYEAISGRQTAYSFMQQLQTNCRSAFAERDTRRCSPKCHRVARRCKTLALPKQFYLSLHPASYRATSLSPCSFRHCTVKGTVPRVQYYT